MMNKPDWQPGMERISGYDLDANRFLPPPQVRAMAWEEQVEWAKAHQMKPTAEAQAAHAKGFLEQARERLRLTNAKYPGGEHMRAAYSMFEMMQPFSSTDDVTVAATTETALTNDEYLSLPSNFFSFPGKCAWFRCGGKTSSVITTPGTAVAKVRYSTPVAGGGIAGTQLTISGTLTPDSVAAHTDNVWWMDTFVKAVAIGKTTTALSLLVWGYFYFASEVVPTTTALWGSRFMPPGGTSLANITSLDGTISKALTATITPTLATFTWTVRDAWIVAMN